MLIKQTLSPRTHEKKYKQVEMALESQMLKFDESINVVVKNFMFCGEDPDLVVSVQDESMTTPKKQLRQLQSPPQFSPTHQLNPKNEEMSLEMREYYEVQKKNTEK